MERLSEKLADVIYDCINAWSQVQEDIVKKAIDRLAAYEDTGITPEEIEGLKNTCDQLYGINDSLYKANQAMGEDLSRYVKLKQEGRLVVLPCKVGDTVFFRTYTQNATVDLGVQPHRVIAARCYMIVEGEYANVGLPVDQFGKTVFLTREEAEKALRGGSSDDP